MGGEPDRRGAFARDAASFGSKGNIIMGLRGPKKKLAALERLEGNPGKKRIIDTGITAAGDVFIPEHLHEDAQGCIEVIRRSMPAGVYSALDSFLLAAFATAWAVHKRAAHEISNPSFDWLTPTAADTVQKNPWFDILRGAARDLMAAGDRLGLNPKARLGLTLPAEKRPRSKFDGLFAPTGSSHSLSA